MQADELLDEAGFARVEAAIRAAEARTSGEIVFAVVERSESYLGPRALFAAALAFAAGVLTLAAPLVPPLSLPALQAGAFALGFAAAGQPRLLRLLLPAGWRREAAERGARLTFLGEGVARTRERTGILIYLSLLEHQVVVLADEGIAARVDESVWQVVVGRILGGIREGAAERGLAEGVALCGDTLAAHFPPGADNPNELPDPLRRL
jgi:putative membrane protein